MYVIRHQAIGMHGTIVLPRKLLQMEQVQDVIALAKEALVPIVPALNNMHGDTRQNEPRLSGHCKKTWTPSARLTEIGI